MQPGQLFPVVRFCCFFSSPQTVHSGVAAMVVIARTIRRCRAIVAQNLQNKRTAVAGQFPTVVFGQQGAFSDVLNVQPYSGTTQSLFRQSYSICCLWKKLYTFKSFIIDVRPSKTEDCVRLYGYRPKFVTADLGCGLGYTPSVSVTTAPLRRHVQQCGAI